MIKKEIEELLDSKIIDFFPETGLWRSNCFRREEIVSEENFPCHLRDINWLASLIMKKYDLFSLGEDTIKEYVKESPYFNKLRNEYEQKIVKWQINWMINDGENWIIESGDDEYLFSTMCDHIFRKGIVDTLLAIGMDIDAIEEGIEQNTDIWLEPLMSLAFENKYNPIFLNISFRLINNSIKVHHNEKLPEPDLEFKNCWLKYRKYQYYQAHKKSVELYGIITPEMQMTDEEVTDLKKYLEEQDQIRLEEIENFSKRKNSDDTSELKQMSESDFYGLSYEDSLPKKQENDKKMIKKLTKVLEKFKIKR